MKKEELLLDSCIEIDMELFKKLDKQVNNDKELSDSEKRLWNSVHLYPYSYTKQLEEVIKQL